MFQLANSYKSAADRSRDPAAAERQLKKAEELFVELEKGYKDVPALAASMRRLDSILFELRYLSVGKQAPDIEGEDTDGKKFKLSDYRGKVIMLDFWGHW
jgi:hypothetical protein